MNHTLTLSIYRENGKVILNYEVKHAHDTTFIISPDGTAIKRYHVYPYLADFSNDTEVVEETVDLGKALVEFMMYHDDKVGLE